MPKLSFTSLGLLNSLVLAACLWSLGAFGKVVNTDAVSGSELTKSNISESKHNAVLGPKNTRIELIIFSDFECPYCSEYAEQIDKWVAEYPDKIKVVFKHFPLSNMCNPTLPANMHPQACEAAVAAQAALQQGKFWEMHDALFKADLSEKPIMEIAREIGLDLEKFEDAYNDPSTSAQVLEDISLGNQLKISGTPSLFINGQLAQNPDPAVVEEQIRELLHKPNQ